MLTKNNKTVFFIICILFFSILFAKLYAIFSPSLLGNIDLAIDEAQYIFWSKSLETGYFSKPPFIAWVLSTMNHACGDNYQCYRSLQPIAFFLSSIFCGLSTFRLTNNFKASCLSAFLFLTLPLSTFYSQFATTDAWLLLFWSTSTFFFIVSLRNGSFFWLLCCAITVGIGLLTKYSMIFFCISALFLLLKLNQFSWLKIIIATSIALLIFLPNIIWNITHDFPTLKHHVEMTSLDKGTEVQIGPLIEFLIGQFIIFSPIIFLIFLLSPIKNWHLFHNDRELLNLKACHYDVKEVWIFSAAFILPIFTTVSFLSLISETEINWASPISIPIVIYFSTLVTREQKNPVQTNFVKLALPITFTTNLLFLLLFLNGPKIFSNFSAHGLVITNPFLQVEGYTTIANIVRDLNYKQGKIIASNDRGLLATLSLYLPDYKVRSLNTNRVYNHWDLKYPLSEKEKKERLLFVLLINNNKDTLQKTMKKLREQFITVEIVATKNTDNLLLQGKTNKKVLLVWVGKEDMV